jgi:hypothetical protein
MDTECSGRYQRCPVGSQLIAIACSTTLHRTNTHTLDHSIVAPTLAALIRLIVMCTITLMSAETVGIAHSANLLSGPTELVAHNMAPLAIVVVFTTLRPWKAAGHALRADASDGGDVRLNEPRRRKLVVQIIQILAMEPR